MSGLHENSAGQASFLELKLRSLLAKFLRIPAARNSPIAGIDSAAAPPSGLCSTAAGVGQLGDRAGLQSARNQLHHVGDDVALYEVLAVAGDVYDARLIERCMRRDGMSEQALLALGGLGYVESLPILTQALALENEGIATAAARALLRMTGAPMWQIMEVEDEDGDSATMEVPVTSPAEWQTWLATKADLFRAGRYRAGAKFSLESCWAELRAKRHP